jgi:SPP1 family phage portal protein
LKPEKVIKNPWGKIPVVYWRQESPEWADVQSICNRQETLISNFADTNDYFASPMIKVTGKVLGFAEKGEQGKIITLADGANVDYLTWDSGPVAIKTEFDNNASLIFTATQLPNLSFEKLTSLGSNNNAMTKLMFSDPHMKVETKWETFGEGVQRRLNLLTAMCAQLHNQSGMEKKLFIKPEMEPYMPKNVKEELDALITATGGEAIMSQGRGVELNPLVENAAVEIKNLGTEAAKRQTESFVMTGE